MHGFKIVVISSQEKYAAKRLDFKKYTETNFKRNYKKCLHIM